MRFLGPPPQKMIFDRPSFVVVVLIYYSCNHVIIRVRFLIGRWVDAWVNDKMSLSCQVTHLSKVSSGLKVSVVQFEVLISQTFVLNKTQDETLTANFKHVMTLTKIIWKLKWEFKNFSFTWLLKIQEDKQVINIKFLTKTSINLFFSGFVSLLRHYEEFLEGNMCKRCMLQYIRISIWLLFWLLRPVSGFVDVMYAGIFLWHFFLFFCLFVLGLVLVSVTCFLSLFVIYE